jgi:hypothetical protein
MQSNDYLEKRFSKDPSMVFRQIADECLLVPIRHLTADLDYIFVLNTVAGRIWELIDGQRQVRDIADQIAAEFEVSPQEAAKDLVELLGQLQEIGGVKEV